MMLMEKFLQKNKIQRLGWSAANAKDNPAFGLVGANAKDNPAFGLVGANAKDNPAFGLVGGKR